MLGGANISAIRLAAIRLLCKGRINLRFIGRLAYSSLPDLLERILLSLRLLPPLNVAIQSSNSRIRSSLSLYAS